MGRVLGLANRPLCKHLMYGLNPRIPIDSLKDNMADNSVGYWFVQDPRNKLDDAYLDLLKRAYLSPLDGLMLQGQWSIPAVNRYLTRKREFVR